MSEGHSLWSPSSLTRRFNCAGSANAEDGMPDTSNENSAEGTAAHIIHDRCLVEDKNVVDFLGEKVKVEEWEFEVTREWVNLLQPGIDWLRDQARKKGAKLYTEYRVDLSIWMPGESGTLDAGIISPAIIIIKDLKFGRTWVPAFKNKQMSGYSLGFIAKHVGFKDTSRKVKLVIDQPRAFNGGSEWDTTIGELLLFGEEMSEKFFASKDPNAPRTPTLDGCNYCKAMVHCNEFATFMLALFYIDIEDKFMIPKARRLPVEDLGKILEHRSLINSALISYQEHAKKLILEEAQEIPHMKMVDGVGNRDWIDEDEVREFLEGKYKYHQIEQRSLKSPAQMENVVGTRNWAKLQSFIFNKPASPVLVKDSDPRPALIPVINLFYDESENILDALNDNDDII